MAIPETEIERVKSNVSLAEVIRSRGVTLKKKGRQLWGLCPFHSDSEPSLAVDEEKGLWNCLGKCGEGGDVFSFVMKADGMGFAEAFEMLKKVSPQRHGENREKKEKGKSGRRAKTVDKPMTKDELEYLEKAVRYYHKSLVKDEKAIGYLKSRGITSEAIKIFRLGYADGSLKDKLNKSGKEALERIGLLNKHGNETMYGSVVFPLIDAASNKCVGLYGRKADSPQRHREHGENQEAKTEERFMQSPRTLRAKHLYLPGTRRGVFNPKGAKEADEVIITESVIDALALWSIGLRNVTCSYGVNGLTDEILDHLAESRIKRVCLMLDSDKSGREASEKFGEKLNEIGIESYRVKLPEKDASEFVASGGTLSQVQSLMSSKRVQSPESEVQSQSETPNSETPNSETLNSEADGTRVLEIESREYRVRGLSPVGLEKLRINLRLSVGSLFHLDTLDLYQARARANFSKAAAKACRVSESIINSDLLLLIEELERERLLMRKSEQGEPEEDKPMTDAEREAALSFLKDPDLCERIVEDFRLCGLVGERPTVLTAYLGSISRKLNEPLALLIVARSGAGKSALQDALCAFVPPEELIRVTRLTGQALFYKDPYSLKRKMLVIAEDEGAMQAVYSLRTLASDQRLSIAATRTDPNTGKLSTEHYEVFGPVVIVITTTSAEAFDEETRSRFVQLTMNESVEQTRAILEKQRHQYTLHGVLEQAESEEIKRLHHHAQRLLKPLAVVNPFVEYLTYPSGRLIHRREQRKYLSLINSIALLHQYQREIKTAKQGETEIEYTEVTLEDIALANELAEKVLSRAMDELAPPVRGMFEEIRKACQTKAKAEKTKAADVQLTRREIREMTGWSDWQVRSYCQKLVEMEYLFALQAVNGKPIVYQLAGDADKEVLHLRGLTSVEELKRKLSGGSSQKSVVSDQLLEKAASGS